MYDKHIREENRDALSGRHTLAVFFFSYSSYGKRKIAVTTGVLMQAFLQHWVSHQFCDSWESRRSSSNEVAVLPVRYSIWSGNRGSGCCCWKEHTGSLATALWGERTTRKCQCTTRFRWSQRPAKRDGCSLPLMTAHFGTLFRTLLWDYSYLSSEAIERSHPYLVSCSGRSSCKIILFTSERC